MIGGWLGIIFLVCSQPVLIVQKQFGVLAYEPETYIRGAWRIRLMAVTHNHRQLRESVAYFSLQTPYLQLADTHN